MHAGFMAQAMQKLPIWRGKTYKGVTMDADYLGLTTAGSYQANDFWSTSEAKSVAQQFLQISAANNAASSGTPVTKAVLCTVDVTNGRDVGRVAFKKEEIEILLPAGSRMAIGKRVCLRRGEDDDRIRTEFGAKFFDACPSITEFWLIELTQNFSGDKDVVGAYENPSRPKKQAPEAPKKRQWAAGARSGAGSPMAGGGGARFNKPGGK
jgi:hypothetical protein